MVTQCFQLVEVVYSSSDFARIFRHYSFTSGMGGHTADANELLKINSSAVSAISLHVQQ